MTQNVTVRRGRPSKYGRPSRAVTVTLPEDVLAKLATVDVDLGRAIVTVTEGQRPPRPVVRSAELANYGRHAVIVVTPLKALKRLPGVELVPVANGRCLISLARPASIHALELGIRDAIESSGTESVEREALDMIAEILRHARASREVTLEERTIIVLAARRARRAV